MNFIRETDPYLRQLDAWKKGHGFSDTEALKRLADIWDEFKEIPERKKVIYGTLNSAIPKTDLSCGSCVHDLLTFVWNWRAALEHEVSTYFEGVQVAEIVEPVKMSFDVPQTFPEVEERHPDAISLDQMFDKQLEQSKWDGIAESVANAVEAVNLMEDKKLYSGLKMHQLRSLAKKKGIEYSNKTTSKELIQLLNAKA